jgi:hypothetical protein
VTDCQLAVLLPAPFGMLFNGWIFLRLRLRSSAPSASKRGGRGRKRRAGSDSDNEANSDGGEEDDETAYMTNRHVFDKCILLVLGLGC